MAQDSNQDMKDTPHVQHTPVRFPLPGKSSGPGYTKGLPTSLHTTSKASAVYERTHTQQERLTPVRVLVLIDFVLPFSQERRPPSSVSPTEFSTHRA